MNQASVRPPRIPVFTLLGLALGIGASYLACLGWLSRLPTIERLYLSTYLHASYVPQPTLRKNATDPYLFYVYKNAGEVLAVTDSNIGHIQSKPYWTSYDWTRPQARNWFRQNIYGGRDVNALLQAPLLLSVINLALFLCGGVVLDRHRHVKFRQGRVLRGPVLRSRWSFNRTVKGDGIGFVLDNWRNPLELLQGKRGKVIRIEREYEAQHIEVIGDTGAGKSQALSQILNQIEERGETAILFDPEREFIQRYHNSVRGDLVANPLDQRCFSWSPSDEIDYSSTSRGEATALAQAESIYPGTPRDRDWFFTNAARLIWQRALVDYKPTAAQLAELMMHANPLIDAVVKGTELEEMFTKAQSAQGLRSSVISTLTAPAFALRQIPPQDDKRPHWVIRDWCAKREGWVFLTSTEDTITALKPIQSLWIDSLIRTLLSMPARSDLRKVWIVIDELASLQFLPQLTNAMNKSRKRDISVVVGFQGRSQPKKIYGEDAETLFSAPYTKLLMRTGEPEAQEWMSKWIGEQEIERFRETRGSGQQRHSYSTEQVNRRIVMASEFSGLKNRVGYLRYGNEVSKIKMAGTWQRPNQAIDYIPRLDEPVVLKPMPNLELIKAAEEAERRTKAIENANCVFPKPQIDAKPKGSLIPKQKKGKPAPEEEEAATA